MSTLLLAALASGGVFFVWSAFSWMALPWQRAVYRAFLDEDAVAGAILANAPASGLYGLPEEPRYPPGASREDRERIDRAAWERIQRGPTLTAVVTREGFPPLPRMLLVAFATYVAVALAFGWMLSTTAGLSYLERVAFITVAGLASGTICRMPDWNWHQYPLRHALVQIANLGAGWLLAGLVLAALVTGRPYPR